MAPREKPDSARRVKKGRVSKSKSKPRRSSASTARRPSSSPADSSRMDTSRMDDSSFLDSTQFTEASVQDTIGDMDTTLNPNPQARPAYSRLKPRMKGIPEDQIQAEWRRLKPPAQEKVKELFTTVKRGVVSTAGAGSEKKLAEADESLEVLMRKLVGKVPAMPFPPRTKEMNFDLGKLSEQNRTLETQLTATLHSAALLKAEIAREERQLKNDHDKLAELRKNAESERRFWKTQAKKMHPLLDFGELPETMEDGPEQIGLVANSNASNSIFDTDDENLIPILSQLQSHLESIHGNSRQVNGIGEAMADASVMLGGLVNQMAATPIV